MTAEGSDHFPEVFTPLQLRHKTLSARINFGAHTANMSDRGLPGDQHVAYYRERALGGAGMIVVEPIPTHPTGVLTRGNFRVDDDAVIPGFRRLTDTCREARDDVVLIHQLYHVGQHGDGDNSFAPSWSPSGLPSYHDADGSHAMTATEIEELLSGFVRAAERASASGFDGVELFAAYHAVIDQFWTPWSNRRDDAWGGTFDKRMRFSRELCEWIRAACGDNFIIGLAVNADPESPASLSVAQLQEVVGWHDERQLIDYVTCGTGSYFDFYKLMPTSLYDAKLGVPFARALSEVTSFAKVQAESHVRTPANAEEVLADGDADMVSIVRGQIADPHLVAKARRGVPEQVRPCISCNQMCWGRRSRDYWISCLVNPSAGREQEWGGDRFTPATTARRVLVIGGGPAGLECARVAAERGHDVTLVEAAPQLGGQFRLAGLQPSRSQVGDNIAWQQRELDRLGVAVELSTPVAAADVQARGPWDEVVVATGATPARRGFQRALPMVDRLPGVDAALAVHDVLEWVGRDVPLPTGRVLLVDDLGDWRGIGTGMVLQEHGADVTIITSGAVVAAGLFHSAADVPARARFVGAGGRMQPHTVLLGWDDDVAVLRATLTGEETSERFDHLVIAETPLAVTGLAAELRAAGIAHHTIGDCVAPRRAAMAFHEGRKLGLSL